MIRGPLISSARNPTHVLILKIPNPPVHSLPYVIITEVAMTLLLCYIILYTYDRRYDISFKERAIVTLVLVMMAGMLESITYYLISVRSFLNTIIAVNISMLTMSIALILLFWVFATKAKTRKLERSSIIAFAGLLIMNEVSMGVFVYTLAFGFTLSQGDLPLYTAITHLLSLGVNSYLFILPMITEMIVFFILRPVKGTHRLLLLALILTTLLSPTITGNEHFTQLGSIIVLGTMTFFLPIIFFSILRSFDGNIPRVVNNGMWIFPILLLMMSGTLFGALHNGSFAINWALYGGSMVWGMAYYFAYSFGQRTTGGKRSVPHGAVPDSP